MTFYLPKSLDGSYNSQNFTTNLQFVIDKITDSFIINLKIRVIFDYAKGEFWGENPDTHSPEGMISFYLNAVKGGKCGGFVILALDLTRTYVLFLEAN